MISLAIALCFAALIVALAILPSLVLPVICCYSKNYQKALRWLRRYFKNDMAFYSPFDLVYLYILTEQLNAIPAAYRDVMRKGSMGSEYFVDAWVSAHQNNWPEAEKALTELRKYTILNDVNPDKLAAAIAHKNAAEIDAIYLIDMNGKAFITPSMFRTIWVVLAGVATFAAIAAGLASVAIYFATLF